MLRAKTTMIQLKILIKVTFAKECFNQGNKMYKTLYIICDKDSLI